MSASRRKVSDVCPGRSDGLEAVWLEGHDESVIPIWD